MKPVDYGVDYKVDGVKVTVHCKARSQREAWSTTKKMLDRILTPPGLRRPMKELFGAAAKRRDRAKFSSRHGR